MNSVINKQKTRISVRDLTYTALACALFAVCAWITVPTEPPFTMQTFAIFLCAGLLGWKRGLAAVAVYLVLGAVGVPVFSNFGGGIAKLAGPTGGYLIGFLLTALITGWVADRFSRRTVPLLLGMLAGAAAYYVFGTLWYFLMFVSQTGMAGLWAALWKCVIPFLPFDAIKLALALLLTRRLDGLVSKSLGREA